MAYEKIKVRVTTKTADRKSIPVTRNKDGSLTIHLDMDFRPSTSIV